MSGDLLGRYDGGVGTRMLNAIELLQPKTVDESRRTYQCRVFLNVFWQKAKSADNKKKKLALLRVFAGLVLGDDPYVAHNQWWARRHFDKHKHRISYLAGGCWVCKLLAECRHHVIQIQHGGRNTQTNIVNLCDSCHHKVHFGEKDPDEWPQTIDFPEQLRKAQAGRKTRKC